MLLLTVNAGLGYALGWLHFGVEKFCPFGGVETLWAVLTNQSFTCATGPFNLSLMLALLALTLVARKSFCSWVCPVGTVHEWLGALGRKLRPRKRGKELGLIAPASTKDAAWRWLRLPVLAAVLAFTVGTGELIFRPYDPYYVLFSAHGHDVTLWSYLVIGLVLAIGIVVPMAWCRYLCPLGGLLWPFSRVGWLRLRRSEGACTDCRACDIACPHGIPVSTVERVDAGECTLCMECTSACRQEGALAIEGAGLARRPLPAWLLALLILIAGTAGYFSAGAFTYSSYDQIYEEPGPGMEPARLTLFVDGVKCVDTAIGAARQLEGLPGLYDLTAYAADNRLELRIDPARLSADTIVEKLQGPVWVPETGEFHFGVFRVRETRRDEPIAKENP